MHQFGWYLSSGGNGVIKSRVVVGGGWFLGAKDHSSRTFKALKKKHMKHQKTIYPQYYNDVYKLQQQNAESAYVDALNIAEEDREIEAIQRHYDEFKQLNLDGNDQISTAEFNMYYANNYLSNYPGLG